MVTKKFIHQIITWLNTFLSIPYVIYRCDVINHIYSKRESFVRIFIKIHSLDENGNWIECINTYTDDIYNEQDFINFKEELYKRFNKDLKLTKETSYERT